MVTKIATGEIEDQHDSVKGAAAEMGRRGGKRRTENVIAERRTEIAKRSARARWRVSADDG